MQQNCALRSIFLETFFCMCINLQPLEQFLFSVPLYVKRYLADFQQCIESGAAFKEPSQQHAHPLKHVSRKNSLFHLLQKHAHVRTWQFYFLGKKKLLLPSIFFFFGNNYKMHCHTKRRSSPDDCLHRLPFAPCNQAHVPARSRADGEALVPPGAFFLVFFL